MSNPILWSFNPSDTFTHDLTEDEIDLLGADISDAIALVLEDWSSK
jgi:hypothetical protein